MPIYEYRCESCGANLEIIQKMSDPPAKRCSRCGADSLHKLMSQTSFILKGSGWYATDYKSRPAEAPTKDGDKGADTRATTDAPKSGEAGSSGSSTT